MKNIKILFIHGYTASSRTDFYPAISNELDLLGVEYAIPNLPGYKHPHANEWLKIIHKTIKDNKPPLVIVGHSLGTRAALLYIEKYQPRVEAVFLIAAFANRVENALRRNGNAYPDFFENILNVELIRKCVKKFYVLHSRDDHSIAFEQGKEIAKDLHAELIPFNNNDHFSGAENAPYILKVLQGKIGI